MAEDFREDRWFDRSTTASRPGRIPLDYAKLEWFRRKLNLGHRYLGVGRVPAQRWAVHLEKGLAEAALVVRAKPLTVAVYTCEFDCVAMLRFKRTPPGSPNFRDGDRLLTVNTFERLQEREPRLAHDLVGQVAPLRWSNVHPAIADLLSSDAAAIEATKAEIAEAEWRRVEELSAAYRKRFPHRARDGNPYISHLEAE